MLHNALTSDLKVSVFSGPVLDDGDPSYRGVALPLQYWKIVAMVRTDGKPSVTAYLLSQSALLDEYPHRADARRTAGVVLLRRLPDVPGAGAPDRRTLRTGSGAVHRRRPAGASRNDRTATRTRATRPHPVMTSSAALSLEVVKSEVMAQNWPVVRRDNEYTTIQNALWSSRTGRVRHRADRRCGCGQDDPRPPGDAVAAAAGAVGGRHRVGAQHPARRLRALGGDRDVPRSGGVPVGGAGNHYRRGAFGDRCRRRAFAGSAVGNAASSAGAGRLGAHRGHGAAPGRRCPTRSPRCGRTATCSGCT